jgi:hypothetical protein
MLTPKPLPGVTRILERFRGLSVLERCILTVLLLSLLGTWVRFELVASQVERRDYLGQVVRAADVRQGLFWLEHGRYAASAQELGVAEEYAGVEIPLGAVPDGYRIEARERSG